MHNDGNPESLELENFFDPLNKFDAGDDNDTDSLSNLDHCLLGSGINNPDSDGAGLTDGEEVNAGTNPLVNEPAINKDIRVASNASYQNLPLRISACPPNHP